MLPSLEDVVFVMYVSYKVVIRLVFGGRINDWRKINWIKYNESNFSGITWLSRKICIENLRLRQRAACRLTETNKIINLMFQFNKVTRIVRFLSDSIFARSETLCLFGIPAQNGQIPYKFRHVYFSGWDAVPHADIHSRIHDVIPGSVDA